MPASWVSAGVGAVGLLNSMGAFGGSGGASTGASTGPGISYGGAIPAADANWWTDSSTANNQALQSFDTTNALNMQALQQGQAINYQPYQQAANTAGQQTGALANTMQGYANTMGNQAQNAIGQQQQLQAAGNAAYQLGMDPQQALYNSTLQQMTDQTAATNSMYGLGSSGAGAGIQNEALQNFNVDWQNQQLQRAATGISADAQANASALGYGNQAGQDLTAAATYGGQVPGLTQQAAQIPLSVQQQIAANPQNLANAYLGTEASATSPLYTNMGAGLAYMTGGSGSQQGAASLQQQANQFNTTFNAQQQQASANALTQGLGGLSSLWGGTANTNVNPYQYTGANTAGTGGGTDYSGFNQAGEGY